MRTSTSVESSERRLASTAPTLSSRKKTGAPVVSEPSLSQWRIKDRPWSVTSGGGVLSRPLNHLVGAPLPGMTFRRTPVTSVSSPFTPERPISGWTIQNWVPPRASSAAPFLRRKRRLTPSSPGLNATATTFPADTPLYSRTVLLASAPAPSAKSIVISGPRSYNSRNVIHPPTATAINGTTQMSGNACARETLGAGEEFMMGLPWGWGARKLAIGREDQGPGWQTG